MDKGRIPKTETITITVEEEGDFKYDKPLVWVYPGDTITWICKNGSPFAIHIGWDSPGKGRYRSPDGEPIKATVREDARPGYYSYTVAVCIDNVIWTDDPPFIVKPPKGSGN